MKFNALARIERNARRAGEILGVLAKYGLADWVKGLNYSWVQERIQSYDGQRIPELNLGERARLAFTELGTTFMKLGQVLSTRPDLVGPEIARELAHLEHEPLDVDHLRRTIREFEEVWGTLTVREQEQMVKLLVSKVVYDGVTGKVTISFRSAGAKELCQGKSE